MSHKKKFLNEPEKNSNWDKNNGIEPEEKLYMSQKEIVYSGLPL